MNADDALRDEIARALFVEGVGPEAAPAWDAPGDGGRQRWWNYADAILPIVTRVEREAYRRGQVEALREAADELGQQGTEPWNRNSLAISTLQLRADSIAREAQS